MHPAVKTMLPYTLLHSGTITKRKHISSATGSVIVRQGSTEMSLKHLLEGKWTTLCSFDNNSPNNETQSQE